MHLSPDVLIYWQYGFFKINSTIAMTWMLMLVLSLGSKLISRKLSTEIKRSRWQNLLEVIILGIEKQIKEVGLAQPEKYIGFLGTLFLFVAASNLCIIIPGYEPPTGSLSTTVALALCVFVAVPVYGITELGVGNYLKSYMKPTIFMLPFNIISEISRTLALALALAVRLFGNMMSGTMIVGILVSITPLLFPIFMTILGLLTGMVQAYIFSILAAVYIAAGSRIRTSKSASVVKDQKTK